MVKIAQDGNQMIALADGMEGPKQVQGTVMGVIRKDEDSNQNLHITSCHFVDQKGGKPPNVNALNEVGFFISCALGLGFNKVNIEKMIEGYKSFKNSVMIVYDPTKADYGLNALKCYRLAENAIKALDLNNAKTASQGNLIQEKIREHDLEISTFFEEVAIKIHRSHLLQAFLFDHVAQKMPVFNMNLLKMGSTSQHLVQHLHISN
jgi:hypothetical protein